MAATDRIVAEIKLNPDNGALERDEQELHGLTTEGGEAVFYSPEETSPVVRADVTLYGEMGQVTHSLSFDAEQRLVLDERHTSEYDQPFGSVARERREQIYLDKGRIVRWVEGGIAKADADDAERRETEGALGELMSEVMSQLE